MIYYTYNYSIHGGFKATYNGGATLFRANMTQYEIMWDNQ
jgi:hypothetical protein